MSEVTVVVPVWNRRDLLPPLFARLRRQSLPAAEILVVDNGSTDGAAEAAEGLGARVIRLGRNAGFAYAVNRGIEACGTDWLAILNNDVEPSEGWLEGLGAALRSPDVWLAVGKVLDAGRRDRIDGTWDALCRGGCAWRVGHGRPDGPEFSQPKIVSFAPMTAALFRRELFDRVGLLNESLGSYLEDVEFGLRCASQGFAGLYVPEAVAWHAGSATLGRWHPEVVRRMARNQVLLVAGHYPSPLPIRYVWSVLVAQGLWGLVALRHRVGMAYLRGLASAFRDFRRVRAHAKTHPRAILDILDRGDREIWEIQRRTGFDFYWRMYFLLTSVRRIDT
ncbi:MAG: glycosyltransferase family 2 protein [Bryobacteraceae bacterium]